TFTLINMSVIRQADPAIIYSVLNPDVLPSVMNRHGPEVEERDQFLVIPVALCPLPNQLPYPPFLLRDFATIPSKPFFVLPEPHLFFWGMTFYESGRIHLALVRFQSICSRSILSHQDG